MDEDAMAGAVATQTRYARSRDVHIACQVVGGGPTAELEGIPGEWRLFAVEQGAA